MNLTRETVIGMFLANLVLTILVVIGVVHLMKDDKAGVAMEDPAPVDESREVETANLEAEFEALDAENRLLALENSQKEILAKLDALASRPAAAPEGELVDGDTLGCAQAIGAATPERD